MKLYNKITFLIAAACSVTFSGCLKDKDYNNGSIQSLRSLADQKVVSMGLTATSTDNHLVIALDNSDADTTINLIPVMVNSANGATEDVNVIVTPEPALVGNYNALNGTAHDVAPADVYTVTNEADGNGGYKVKIPRGSNTGFLAVKIKPSNFLGSDYAMAFKVTGVPSGYLISTNLGTGIVAIAIKNEWDGIYDYKGYALRAGDPVLTGNFSGKEMALITAGATSVKFGDLPLWGDGNGRVSIGYPILDIDNSGGSPYPITITSNELATVRNNPGYTSVYDPATRTFYVSYTWNAGPASRLKTDTLTYLRPR